jgi:AcrR family transcriptional regulator
MIFDNGRRATGVPAGTLLSQGSRTRRVILARALRIAAREGLAALSIGRLAKELEMSKSGLFAHFHSKKALELATVEMANEVFQNAVLRPARASERGIKRVWALCDLWRSHVERRVFSGSYFFTGALFEYANRPGPVSKAIKNATQEWLKALAKAVADAQDQREIGRGLRADQIALELNGKLLGAHCAYLLENGDFFRKAPSTLLGRLRELATNAIPARAFESVGAWERYLKTQH